MRGSLRVRVCNALLAALCRVESGLQAFIDDREDPMHDSIGHFRIDCGFARLVQCRW